MSENIPGPKPILYSFRRCPFAMRARMALWVSENPCELREVVLQNKPQALLNASPKGTVPVLITPTGQVLDQSLEIMLWSLQGHDPEAWLVPTQGTLVQMLDLIGEFDNQFKYHLDRYKYAERYENTDALSHRREASQYLQRLNARLSQHPYLFGNHPTLADRAIIPFVRQFAIADPAWFDAQPWLALQTWLCEWVNSDLYANIMQKYPPWVAGDPGVEFGPTVKIDLTAAGDTGEHG